ncbi:MAG: RagB/SusD family nutrient uptake outer membrane protein, partial [Flavobacteriia bacterium]|nr:RagB/SusD family nutrient uptake outer membrane protein [Flavobacteriia bacterium]
LNYKVIRYADVLLMAAEAHAQNGNDATALSYVNQVRDRVSMPALTSGGSTLLADIFHERRLELSGEGLRFWDLVRSGQAAQEISNFQVGKHELFPLPQVEIDLAGGNWPQNAGY